MKHVVVIAEGIEASLLESEVKAGRLPWFGKVSAAGGYFPMDCGPVPYEPNNLATAFSGVGCGGHGCFSYWDMEGEQERARVLEAADVRAKRIWEWPEMDGLNFCVVNVQLTHPPFELNGRLITYPMGATLRASYPADLLRTLSDDGVRYAHDVTVFYKGQPFETFAKEAWIAAERQLETALALDDREEADVFIINLTLPDRLSHFLWYELENPGHTGGRPQILQAYDFVDRACAEFERRAKGSTMVFSEIGFGGIDGFASIDSFLQKAGLQVVDTEGNCDISKSAAMETAQGSHGIKILDPSAEAQVVAALKGFKFDDGVSVVSEVARREDVYKGRFVTLAPDLVVQPGDPRRPPLGDPRWANHVRRQDQSGWHRRSGFFALTGLDHDIQAQNVCLEAIAPTIARMANRDVPAGLDAASLIL